jgi:hypothetical protein
MSIDFFILFYFLKLIKSVNSPTFSTIFFQYRKSAGEVDMCKN